MIIIKDIWEWLNTPVGICILTVVCNLAYDFIKTKKRNFNFQRFINNQTTSPFQMLEILNGFGVLRTYTDTDFERELIKAKLMSFHPLSKICVWLGSQNDLNYLMILCKEKK